METPKEIYVHIRKEPRPSITFSEVEEKDCENIKYIRADIAELTWEDIEKILNCIHWAQDCLGGLMRKAVYEKALCRFNKQKKK